MFLRSILILGVAVALAAPAAALAGPDPTRVSLAPAAVYASPQQLNVEVALTCDEGLFFSISASVLQQGPFGQVFGSGFTQGRCTGTHQKLAVAVTTFAFPGWQLGDALASVSACAFTCDSAARSIRIGL
jgi:hypothetical protein